MLLMKIMNSPINEFIMEKKAKKCVKSDFNFLSIKIDFQFPITKLHSIYNGNWFCGNHKKKRTGVIRDRPTRPQTRIYSKIKSQYHINKFYFIQLSFNLWPIFIYSAIILSVQIKIEWQVFYDIIIIAWLWMNHEMAGWRIILQSNVFILYKSVIVSYVMISLKTPKIALSSIVFGFLKTIWNYFIIMIWNQMLKVIVIIY